VQKYPEGLQVWNKAEQLPFHLASRIGDSRLVKALADSRPQSLRETDFHGNLPLHLLAGRGRSFKKLVDLYPEGLKIRNKTKEGGQLPIHIAAISNCLPVVQALVNSWPESLQETDFLGNLPFHLLARHGHGYGRSFKSFKHMVDLYPEGLKIRTKGLLPIDVAACNKKVDTMVGLAEEYPEALLRIEQCSFDPVTEFVREKLPKYMFSHLETFLRIRERARDQQRKDTLKTSEEKIKATEEESKDLKKSIASIGMEKKVVERALAEKTGHT
jgi:ankyrin repeat protein